jgi:Transposase DDE domain
MQRRQDERPDAVRVRRSVVEHVFGTIKDWMGRDHFRTRRLANVGTEMSLHVLAYNSTQPISRIAGKVGSGATADEKPDRLPWIR